MTEICPNCGTNLLVTLTINEATPAQAINRKSIENLKLALGDDAKLLEFATEGDTIIVHPKAFIEDKATYARIAEVMRAMGGVWIKEGRASRWEL